MAELHVLRVFCDAEWSFGNPLGVFLDGEEVPEERRQGVAAELGFSETVFVDDAASGRVRVAGGRTFVAARPEWGPSWEFFQLTDALAVEEATGLPGGDEGVGSIWAWIDEAEGTVRSRCFSHDDGMGEDEATGSAAICLAVELGRDIEIRQGRGSRLDARFLGEGRAEVGGRVVLDEVRDFPL